MHKARKFDTVAKDIDELRRAKELFDRLDIDYDEDDFKVSLSNLILEGVASEK